jgi:hypothetical protein
MPNSMVRPHADKQANTPKALSGLRPGTSLLGCPVMPDCVARVFGLL